MADSPNLQKIPQFKIDGTDLWYVIQQACQRIGLDVLGELPSVSQHPARKRLAQLVISWAPVSLDIADVAVAKRWDNGVTNWETVAFGAMKTVFENVWTDFAISKFPELEE